MYYRNLREDLAELKVRLRLAPDATRAELLQDDAWKYYATHLDHGHRQEATKSRTRLQALPSVSATMRVPSGQLGKR
jgi:hypothetical protein